MGARGCGAEKPLVLLRFTCDTPVPERLRRGADLSGTSAPVTFAVSVVVTIFPSGYANMKHRRDGMFFEKDVLSQEVEMEKREREATGLGGEGALWLGLER